jgi:lipoyl-dependent peroxiredoxin
MSQKYTLANKNAVSLRITLKSNSMKRNATAIWSGSVKEGTGSLTTESGVLDQTQYSFNSRFEDGQQTNPEELVAAAHAGCFSMQLSAYLGEAGFTASRIETKCEIEFKDGSIVASHLAVDAAVDGIEDQQFQELVTRAEQNCPISKLLNTKISSSAKLL